MKSPIGKRRTREHIIADLSICFVEWQVLLCGFTVERIRHDYGIDLELKTYNALGEREPGDILLQVKATDSLPLRDGQADFPFRVERADLLWWLHELEPVILIVMDAKKTRAYWLCVQDYFASLKNFNLFAAGKKVTVRFPVANKVNRKAIRGFAMLRNQFRERSKRPSHD